MKGIVEMAQEEAREEYLKYKEVIMDRKEKQYEEIKKVYHALSKGHKVIDIFDAFKRIGVNKDGEPKLAICRADYVKVLFEKEELGSGSFLGIEKDKWLKESVRLPSGTFENWEREKDGQGNPKAWAWAILRQKIKTGVPIIPAHLLPNGKLENYYILWEVKDWTEAIPPKKDPYLLRRISTNLFSVLAEWNVTDVERAVLRGYQ